MNALAKNNLNRKFLLYVYTKNRYFDEMRTSYG